MHERNVAGLEHHQVHARTHLFGERVHQQPPPRAPGAVAKRVECDLLERRAKMIAARERVLVHEAGVFDRACQPIGGRLRQLERAADVRQRDRSFGVGKMRQEPERFGDRRMCVGGHLRRSPLNRTVSLDGTKLMIGAQRSQGKARATPIYALRCRQPLCLRIERHWPDRIAACASRASVFERALEDLRAPTPPLCVCAAIAAASRVGRQ